MFTVAAFDSMLAIDSELASAIERGVVVVEPISEDESRQMLAREIADLEPQRRPRVQW